MNLYDALFVAEVVSNVVPRYVLPLNVVAATKVPKELLVFVIGVSGVFGTVPVRKTVSCVADDVLENEVRPERVRSTLANVFSVHVITSVCNN